MTSVLSLFFATHVFPLFCCCNTTSTQDNIGEAQAKPVHVRPQPCAKPWRRQSKRFTGGLGVDIHGRFAVAGVELMAVAVGLGVVEDLLLISSGNQANSACFELLRLFAASDRRAQERVKLYEDKLEEVQGEMDEDDQVEIPERRKCEEEALVRIREMLQDLKPGRKTPPPQCSKT